VQPLKEKAIPIFRSLHPGCDGTFMFDNSQNHHAIVSDTLSVSKMHLSDGGRNARIMRSGWFIDCDGERVEQSMVTQNGLSKGLKRVLMERGLYIPGLSVQGAKSLLKPQPDLKKQMELLQETLLEEGFLIDYYPKYDCEFNYIEMFWGAAKAFARARCTFNFNDLVNLVPQALIAFRKQKYENLLGNRTGTWTLIASMDRMGAPWITNKWSMQ
jgi:hypothetical protein